MGNELDRLQKGEESRYNSTLDILRRVNSLIEDCVRASSNDTSAARQAWFFTLEALDRELRPYLNKEQVTQLNESRPKAFGVQRGLQTGMGSPSRGQLKIYENQIRFLLAAKGMQLAPGKDKGSLILGGE